MGGASTKINVLLVGLEGVGKTTLLYHLHLREAQPDFAPTTGFNYEVIERIYDKTKFEFHFWDLAGTRALRPLWRHFYRNMEPDVLLFVVDANNREQIDEARDVLHRLLHEEKLHNALKLVVSNVKDERLGAKMKESEVRDELGLKGIKHFQVKVIEVNAITADGFDLLLNQICKSIRL